MSLRSILSYAWKVPVCGLAFMAGTVLGSMLAGAMGMQAPPMPAGTDPQTLLLAQLVASPLLALALAFLSRGMEGGWVARWLILSFLAWIAYSVNTLLETAIFTTLATASSFTAIIQLVGSFACGAAVAALFRPSDKGQGLVSNARTFFSRRPTSAWAWRIPLAAVSFLPIYLFFGTLVARVTYGYYAGEVAGLTAPGWGEILPVLFVRSLLFLAASLPVLVAWGKSPRRLILSLGFAMFVLVGAMGLIGGYWLPLDVRAYHGLEILADSMIYAWVIVALLWTPRAPRLPVGE